MSQRVPFAKVDGNRQIPRRRSRKSKLKTLKTVRDWAASDKEFDLLTGSLNPLVDDYTPRISNCESDRNATLHETNAQRPRPPAPAVLEKKRKEKKPQGKRKRAQVVKDETLVLRRRKYWKKELLARTREATCQQSGSDNDSSSTASSGSSAENDAAHMELDLGVDVEDEEDAVDHSSYVAVQDIPTSVLTETTVIELAKTVNADTLTTQWDLSDSSSCLKPTAATVVESVTQKPLHLEESLHRSSQCNRLEETALVDKKPPFDTPFRNTPSQESSAPSLALSVDVQNSPSAADAPLVVLSLSSSQETNYTHESKVTKTSPLCKPTPTADSSHASLPQSFSFLDHDPALGFRHARLPSATSATPPATAATTQEGDPLQQKPSKMPRRSYETDPVVTQIKVSDLPIEHHSHQLPPHATFVPSGASERLKRQPASSIRKSKTWQATDSTQTLSTSEQQSFMVGKVGNSGSPWLNPTFPERMNTTPASTSRPKAKRPASIFASSPRRSPPTVSDLEQAGPPRSQLKRLITEKDLQKFRDTSPKNSNQCKPLGKAPTRTSEYDSLLGTTVVVEPCGLTEGSRMSLDDKLEDNMDLFLIDADNSSSQHPRPSSRQSSAAAVAKCEPLHCNTTDNAGSTQAWPTRLFSPERTPSLFQGSLACINITANTPSATSRRPLSGAASTTASPDYVEKQSREQGPLEQPGIKSIPSNPIAAQNQRSKSSPQMRHSSSLHDRCFPNDASMRRNQQASSSFQSQTRQLSQTGVRPLAEQALAENKRAFSSSKQRPTIVTFADRQPLNSRSDGNRLAIPTSSGSSAKLSLFSPLMSMREQRSSLTDILGQVGFQKSDSNCTGAIRNVQVFRDETRRSQEAFHYPRGRSIALQGCAPLALPVSKVNLTAFAIHNRNSRNAEDESMQETEATLSADESVMTEAEIVQAKDRKPRVARNLVAPEITDRLQKESVARAHEKRPRCGTRERQNPTTFQNPAGKNEVRYKDTVSTTEFDLRVGVPANRSFEVDSVQESECSSVGESECSSVGESESKTRPGPSSAAMPRDLQHEVRSQSVSSHQGSLSCETSDDIPASPNSDSSESTSIASTELWTAELAGTTNVVPIFRLNGRRYRHPALPAGWNLGISERCNRPYYYHPDFGCSFFPPIVLPSMDNIRIVTRRSRPRNQPSSPMVSVATEETCSLTASVTSNCSDERQSDSPSHSPIVLENLDDTEVESTRHACETDSNDAKDDEEPPIKCEQPTSMAGLQNPVKSNFPEVKMTDAAATAKTMLVPSCMYQANAESSAAVDSNEVQLSCQDEAQAPLAQVKFSVKVHKHMGYATTEKAVNKQHRSKHFELNQLSLPSSEQTPGSGARSDSPLQGVNDFGTANTDVDEGRTRSYPDLNERRSPCQGETFSRAEFLAHEHQDCEFPTVNDDFDQDHSCDSLDSNERQVSRQGVQRDESPLRNENERSAFEMDDDHVSEGPQGVSPPIRCLAQRSTTAKNTSAVMLVQALDDTTLSPVSGDDDEFEENDLKFPAAHVDGTQAIASVRQSPQSSVSTEDSCLSSEVDRRPFRRRRSIDTPKDTTRCQGLPGTISTRKTPVILPNTGSWDDAISCLSPDESLRTVNIHVPTSRTIPSGNAGRSSSFSHRVRFPAPHPLCSLQNIEALPLPSTGKSSAKTCTRIVSDSKSKRLSTGIGKTTRRLPRKGYATNRPVVSKYTHRKEQPAKRRKRKSVIPRSLRRI